MYKRVLAVSFYMLFISNIVSADIIRGIDIDFVIIGNAGNVGDTRTDYPYSADPYGCGAVSYEYQIGKYEITNGQWDTFVSAAGAPTGNPSNAYDDDADYTGTDIPANNISWYEAAQFCNYLTSGNKSLGAYQLGIDGSIAINRNSAVSAYGIAYVIPTEDEWYKAAYYKPDGSGYSTYTNGTDIAPLEGSDDRDYEANFGSESPWNVGSGIEEQNGTFDMIGNVIEWNEALIDGSKRGVRCGHFLNSSQNSIRSSYRFYLYPNGDGHTSGFRVVSVPEPATLLLFGLGGLILRRKR